MKLIATYPAEQVYPDYRILPGPVLAPVQVAIAEPPTTADNPSAALIELHAVHVTKSD